MANETISRERGGAETSYARRSALSAIMILFLVLLILLLFAAATERTDIIRLGPPPGRSSVERRDAEAALWLASELGVDWLYIFWFASGAAADMPAPQRERTLVAFRSADAAMAFAQTNGMTGHAVPARVRRLAPEQLVAAVLANDSIAALLIADDDQAGATTGALPRGRRIERAAIAARSQPERS